MNAHYSPLNNLYFNPCKQKRNQRLSSQSISANSKRGLTGSLREILVVEGESDVFSVGSLRLKPNLNLTSDYAFSLTYNVKFFVLYTYRLSWSCLADVPIVFGAMLVCMVDPTGTS
jgi:hypothetical protein